MAFTIRPFSIADLAAVRWLHDRTPPAGQVAVEPQHWPSTMDDIPRNYLAFWVAEEMSPHSGALVGMVGLADAALPDEPPLHTLFDPTRRRMARLHAMRVAPERQRQGIGRALAEVSVSWAAEQGFESVILDTTAQQEAAVALYRAVGFQERTRSMFGVWPLVWLEYEIRRGGP